MCIFRCVSFQDQDPTWDCLGRHSDYKWVINSLDHNGLTNRNKLKCYFRHCCRTLHCMHVVQNPNSICSISWVVKMLLLKRSQKITMSSWAKIAFHRLNLLILGNWRMFLGNHILCMFSTSHVPSFPSQSVAHWMLQGEIQNLAVTPTELNLGVLASTTTSELQPLGITILYVYCKRAAEQLHTRGRQGLW